MDHELLHLLRPRNAGHLVFPLANKIKATLLFVAIHPSMTDEALSASFDVRNINRPDDLMLSISPLAPGALSSPVIRAHTS
jgi:hypothetical protein